ncbi:MAG: YlbF family regulator [Clostridia bacterium]|nr:YlbF family regulator [Clostridia bacterium]
MTYDEAHVLARAVANSPECVTYKQLKETVLADETTAALIKEYKKLQVSLQMAAMSGQNGSQEDMQRFSGITALLFSKPEVAQFLQSEMLLQKSLADIFNIITEASGLSMDFMNP